MEITIELLQSLKADDLMKIEKYTKLLEEAKEAVQIIVSCYRFNLKQDKIKVYSSGDNAEYLLHSGVWQARYLHQSYDINITVEAVFDVFKEEYEYRLSKSSKVNNKADSAGYFRSFISRTKEEYQWE